MENILTAEVPYLRIEENGRDILKDASLSLAPGEFVLLSGPTGSGKSTLLDCVTGTVPRFRKAFAELKVTVNGTDIASVPLSGSGDTVGYMLQDVSSQIAGITVFESIAFGLCCAGMPREEILSLTGKYLELFGLADVSQRRVTTLSGGQLQRCVLAGILIQSPPVIVLDQPCAQLDPVARRDIYMLLREMSSKNGTAVLMAADRMGEALPYADRVVLMEEGRTAASVPASACPAREPCFYREKKAARTGETVMELRNVSYRYPRTENGVNGISLSLEKGTFTCVCGKNGSGKSTLLKLTEGLLCPSSGEVFLFGEKAVRKDFTRFRKRIGYLFQDPSMQIFCDTVREEIGYALKVTGKREDAEELILKAARAAGVEELLDVNPQKLSGGQRQMVALASVLAPEPEIIICDEPSSGVNDAQREKIVSVLCAEADRGCTVLTVTHDTKDVWRYADRLICLENGRVRFDMPAGKDTLIELVRAGLLPEEG